MLQIICSFGAALAPLWRHCSNIWSSIDSPPWFNKLLVVWEQNSHWEQLRECVDRVFFWAMLNNVTFMQCLANNSRAKIWACFRIAYRNGIFRGLERYASFLEFQICTLLFRVGHMQERYWQLSAAHIRNCLSILNPSHYMIKKKGFHFPMIRFLSFLKCHCCH